MQLDVGRHVLGQVGEDRGEARQHLGAVLAVGVRLVALQAREHRGGDVELDRDFAMRQRRRDLVDLALERFVVDRIERLMQVVLQEQPDHRMRRHQIDLEAHIAARCCRRA